MVSIARKNLLRDRVRFVITLAGVSFAVVLMVIQAGIYLGFVQSASEVIDHSRGDVWVAAADTINFDSAKPIDARRAHQVRAIPGVLWVEKLVNTWALLKMPNGATQSVQIVGFNPETGVGGPWAMAQGSFRDVRGRDRILLDESALSRLGDPRVGDRVEILDRKATIAGITRGVHSFTTYPIAFTSHDEALRYSGHLRPTHTTFLVAKVAPGADVEAVVAAARRLPGLDAWTRRDFSAKTRRYWSVQTGMGIGIGLTVLLGFLVGLAVVGQTIYASTLEHLREFGTLKAIGASNREIYGIILEQALLTAILGYGIGGTVVVFARDFYEAMGVVVLTPPAIWTGMFAVTLGMCLLASVISIRKAVRVDPVIVFRA